MTFRSLKDALANGWTVYDRFARGYVLKKKVGDEWVLGLWEAWSKEDRVKEYLDQQEREKNEL